MTDHALADILLVEDNPGDARLTREALRDGHLANTLRVVTDGEAAIDFLRRRGDFADAPRPGLILLDVHLPRKPGTEVLREIKADADLCRIPVIVLTNSTPDRDPEGILAMKPERCLPKPTHLDDFQILVSAIEELLDRP